MIVTKRKGARAAKMFVTTERELESQVRDLAKMLGWKYFHPWLSIHSPRGMPDLTLSKTLMDGQTVVIFAELKRDDGKPTPAQVEWLEQLTKAQGCFSFLWTPSQLELIAEALQAKGLPEMIATWKTHVLYAKSHFGLNLATQGKE